MNFDQFRSRGRVPDFEVFSCVKRAGQLSLLRGIGSHCSASDTRIVPAAPISADRRMLRSGWLRLSRNAGVAIAALCAGFLLLPGSAEASCGDYVLIGNSHAPMARSSPDRPTDGSPPDRADHGFPHRQCHGPGCSNGSVPPTAPSRGATESIERWAHTPAETLPNPVSSPNALGEPIYIPAPGFHLSILRPPR